MSNISGPAETPLDASRSSLSIQFGGEMLELLPERGVWWPSRRTLFVTDPHFGKEATLRSAGVPVPDQTEQMLRRLGFLVDRLKPETLMILGDLIHARRGRCQQTFELVKSWRAMYPQLKTELIRGNHDDSAGDPPAAWQFLCHASPYSFGPLMLCHYPNPIANSAVLAGHLHPAVRLTGPGRDTVKLPCFLLRKDLLILPAFSEFVDGSVQKPVTGDRIFGICEGAVLDLSPAG